MYSPDTIASNQVLEHECNLVNQQIASLKVSKKPIPDDLQDMKSAYEIKMNLLITMVQMGTLTMPGI
jgi:hypothetical protein